MIILRAEMALTNLSAHRSQVSEHSSDSSQLANRARCGALDSTKFVISMQKMLPILTKYQNGESAARAIHDLMECGISEQANLKSFLSRFDLLKAKFGPFDLLDELRLKLIVQRNYIILIQAYNFKLSRIVT
jgi:hypothetical protein